MTAGRCSGCGYTDASCKKVRSHVMLCPDYKKLFLDEPDKALDPEVEFARFKEWEESEEGQAAKETARSEKRDIRHAATDKRIKNEQSRWKK